MKLGWAAGAGATALVFVDDFDDGTSDDAGDENERDIVGEDGHHLQRVRRVRVDETVVIADGDGHWYLTRVMSVGDATLTVERVSELHREPEPAPRITIGFAPAKSDHGVEVVHQLVELGVDRIIPLITRRGVVRCDGARGEKAWARMQRAMRAAAMQCHRARIPTLDPPTALSALRRRTGLLIAHRDGVPIDGLDPPDVDGWCVVVGPEGGFAPEELAMLDGVTRVRVGPHVLRSVTAPVAIAAALAATRRG